MKITTFATLLSAAMLAPIGATQNLLANPGFENGLTGWNVFGNVSAENTNAQAGIAPRTGNTLCKMFGQFIGGFNVTGAFQSFSAAPGQTYTIDCWSRQWAFDPLTGSGAPNDNWAVMKIAFFDAANVELGSAERTVLDGTFPQNTWIDNSPVSGTAPAGTTRVEALLLFIQPGVGTGAAQFDDVVFTGPSSTVTYPGTGEDLVLSTAVGGATLSTTDVKLAPGGSVLELNLASPGSTFNLLPYVMIGQAFNTGSPPVPNPIYPELWFNFSTFFVLVNGLIPTPIGTPRIGPNGGSSSFYRAPLGFAGTSVIVQGLVILPVAANGLYAATDAHELRLQ